MASGIKRPAPISRGSLKPNGYRFISTVIGRVESVPAAVNWRLRKDEEASG